jgi:hypothetical protein
MPPTETETATIEPAVDVDGTATPPPVPTDPSTGPPDPVPSPPPRRVPPAPAPVAIAIPDGEPAAAALALLHAVRPDAPSILAGRIEALTRQIADQIEEARLASSITLPEFIGHAARRAKLRRALQVRAGETPEPAAATVLAAVRAVRRWRPAEEFRRERAKLVERLRGELARAEAGVHHLVAAARAGNGIAHPDQQMEAAGWNHEHDALMLRFEASLKARRDIAHRLAKLDARGDAGRSAAVQSAIQAAGDVDAVVKALAPSMTAAASAELDRVRRAMDDAAGQLDRIDPETRRAAELRQRLEQLRARIPELQWTVAHQQSAAAGAMVAAAIAGPLPAVQALESAVQPALPELAAALNAVRADGADLVNVVAELIGE